MNTRIKSILARAQSILNRNWSVKYTRPSITLYPHQWSWDSAFIAIGYAHYDQRRAEREILSLFSGQWQNGLLPHVVFHQAGRNYFPGADFWQTQLSSHAPRKPFTSGIIQPPLHATTALHIYRYAKYRQRARLFLSRIFPNLKAWHAYLYRYRDPFKEGLVYVRHPWESGQDNSPLWDQVLSRMQFRPHEIPSYQRVDDRLVDAKERPWDEDYDRYVFLIKLFRDCRYDEQSIRQNSPFLVQDVLFNTLLCQANQDLTEIAQLIGEDPTPFEEWAAYTACAINSKLWDEKHAIYVDYDLVADRYIDIHVATGFSPMFGGIPDPERMQRMFNHMNTSCFCGLNTDCYAVPSYDKCSPDFSAQRYWRGPVWLNINWILCRGLQRFGFRDYVERVYRTMIDLPSKYGFYEYFDPEKGCGLGSRDFSWTAALLLDLAYRKITLDEEWYRVTFTT